MYMQNQVVYEGNKEKKESSTCNISQRKNSFYILSSFLGFIRITISIHDQLNQHWISHLCPSRAQTKLTIFTNWLSCDTHGAHKPSVNSSYQKGDNYLQHLYTSNKKKRKVSYLLSPIINLCPENTFSIIIKRRRWNKSYITFICYWSCEMKKMKNLCQFLMMQYQGILTILPIAWKQNSFIMRCMWCLHITNRRVHRCYRNGSS